MAYAPDLKPDDIRVTSSGACGEDLLLSPAAQELYPLVIECKNQEALNIWASLDQAASHLKSETMTPGGLPAPVLFFRRNRSGLFAALPAKAFLKLIR